MLIIRYSNLLVAINLRYFQLGVLHSISDHEFRLILIKPSILVLLDTGVHYSGVPLKDTYSTNEGTCEYGSSVIVFSHWNEDNLCFYLRLDLSFEGLDISGQYLML